MKEKSKILLIGGSSDLGRALAIALPNTVNFDIHNQNDNASEFFLGNLTNPKDLKLCPNIKTIIHISGIHPLISNDQNKKIMKQVNIDGVDNVLTVLQPDKFIYISSSAATKSSDYGLSKLAGEQIVESYSNKNPDSQNYILRTKGFTPFTSPSYKNFLDYANWNLNGSVHISDVVQSVIKCLQDNKLNYSKFLVTGKDEFSNTEKQTWGKDMLLKKYPLAQDLINQLTIPKTPPIYGDFTNSLGFFPQYGFSQVTKEWIENFQKK